MLAHLPLAERGLSERADKACGGVDEATLSRPVGGVNRLYPSILLTPQHDITVTVMYKELFVIMHLSAKK